MRYAICPTQTVILLPKDAPVQHDFGLGEGNVWVYGKEKRGEEQMYLHEKNQIGKSYVVCSDVNRFKYLVDQKSVLSFSVFQRLTFP